MSRFYASIVDSILALVVLSALFVGDWGELMPVALVVGKLSLSLKPRFHHNMVGVIAIQRISNLTVTGNALQCH
jgi:hypothetical protein